MIAHTETQALKHNPVVKVKRGTGLPIETQTHGDKHKLPLLETDIAKTCMVQNKLMQSIQ